jgi:hypothetical protein
MSILKMMVAIPVCALAVACGGAEVPEAKAPETPEAPEAPSTDTPAEEGAGEEKTEEAAPE